MFIIAYEQAVIMHDQRHIHVIMNIIVNPKSTEYFPEYSQNTPEYPEYKNLRILIVILKLAQIFLLLNANCIKEREFIQNSGNRIAPKSSPKVLTENIPSHKQRIYIGESCNLVFNSCFRNTDYLEFGSQQLKRLQYDLKVVLIVMSFGER